MAASPPLVFPEAFRCTSQPVCWQRAHFLCLTLSLGFSLTEDRLLPPAEAWATVLQALPAGWLVDRGLPKREAEWLLSGSLTARERVGHLQGEVAVGSAYRKFMVRGGNGAACPLVWEHTLGGPEDPTNPLGWNPAKDRGGPETRPLVFDPEHPGPACPGPMGPYRMQGMGTYDGQWLAERWPGPPDDCTWEFANLAQGPQRLPQGLRDDETLLVRGFGQADMLARLPGIALAGEYAPKKGGAALSLPMTLDTLWLFPDSALGLLLWHGVLPCVDDVASDIKYALIARASGRVPVCPGMAAKTGAEPPSVEAIPEPSGPEPSPVLPMPPMNRKTLLAGAFQRGSLHEEFAGKDLSGRNFSNRDLSRAVMREAVLRGANLSGADLSEADLSGADLRGAVLDGAYLRGASLAGADMTGASACGALFLEVDCQHCVMAGMALTDSEFEACPMHGAMLDEARCRGMSMKAVRGKGLSALKADLSGATLRENAFALARFNGAQFTGASIVSCDFSGSSFQNARCDSALFEGRTLLCRADFSGANLNDAEWLEVLAEEVVCHRVRAATARFTGSIMSASNWRGAMLEGADFSRAVLAGADFERANLLRAKFRYTVVTGASFRGANLYGALVYRWQADGQTDCAEALLGKTIVRAAGGKP